MATSTHNPLPESGFVGMRQIIGNLRANPPIPALIPICKSSWWAGVADGRYPKGIKLGRRTVWSVDSIRTLLERIATGGAK